MKNLAPIVLFAYKRLKHITQTVEALKKNKFAPESELFIYSDGPKEECEVMSVQKVREYLKNVDGFRKITIIERDINFGLANNIIDGVTNIVNEYGKVIVLEDDLVTSPLFLDFMNISLEIYKDEPKVVSIHGYVYPIEGLPDVFFLKGADCWGWATWADKWRFFEKDGKKLLDQLINKKLQKEADFNGAYNYTKMLRDQIKGKNDSWAVRWYISAFLKDMLTLYPGRSYVKNIGFDNLATHTQKNIDIFDVEFNNKVFAEKIPAWENKEARKKVEIFLKSTKVSWINRLKSNFLKRLNERYH